MSRHLFATTPRMQIVWDALEAAKDNGDDMVIAACRRLIVADRLGWKKHAERRDVELVMSLAPGFRRSIWKAPRGLERN